MLGNAGEDGPDDQALIEHLTWVMDEAAAALGRAGMTVDDLLAGLDEARAEVVTEHYGAAFMDEVESLAADLDTAGN